MELQNSKLGGANQSLINKKSFTMIELISIIVLVSIIFLITAPNGILMALSAENIKALNMYDAVEL